MELEAIVSVSWWMIAPLFVVGSILHFIYDWSGGQRWAAVLGAVNESYWEHIKIAIWPVLLLQVVLYALGGFRYPAFIPPLRSRSTLCLFRWSALYGSTSPTRNAIFSGLIS